MKSSSELLWVEWLPTYDWLRLADSKSKEFSTLDRLVDCSAYVNDVLSLAWEILQSIEHVILPDQMNATTISLKH